MYICTRCLWQFLTRLSCRILSSFSGLNSPFFRSIYAHAFRRLCSKGRFLYWLPNFVTRDTSLLRPGKHRVIRKAKVESQETAPDGNTPDIRGMSVCFIELQIPKPFVTRACRRFWCSDSSGYPFGWSVAFDFLVPGWRSPSSGLWRWGFVFSHHPCAISPRCLMSGTCGPWEIPRSCSPPHRILGGRSVENCILRANSLFKCPYILRANEG